MKYGDVTQQVGNVLTGTPYAQLARATRVKIRAFEHQAGHSSAGDVESFPNWNVGYAVLTSGSITQSRVVLSKQYSGFIGEQAKATPVGGPVGIPPARLGITDCDTIFEGVLPAGSISLTFPQASETRKVVWDIEI